VVVTSNVLDVNATAYYDRIAELLEAFQIPYALIFGNHDDVDREVGLATGTTIK
jgi:DNA repair exonuclease SbcCD nuclease subunit